MWRGEEALKDWEKGKNVNSVVMKALGDQGTLVKSYRR